MKIVHRPQVVEFLNLVVGEDLPEDASDEHLLEIERLLINEGSSITLSDLDQSFSDGLDMGISLASQMKTIRETLT